MQKKMTEIMGSSNNNFVFESLDIAEGRCDLN
jgi:hypothetical protein